MVENEKPQGKVEIRVGNISFTGEGDQDWLGEQVTKVIDAAPKVQVTSVSADSMAASPGEPRSAAGDFNASLASFLKEKGGETKQVQRFLATAAWLFRRGSQELDTSAVAKALTENHQKRLGNPADCLNQNVSKGYCEKKKDGGFFITPEGWKELGELQ